MPVTRLQVHETIKNSQEAIEGNALVCSSCDADNPYYCMERANPRNVTCPPPPNDCVLFVSTWNTLKEKPINYEVLPVIPTTQIYFLSLFEPCWNKGPDYEVWDSDRCNILLPFNITKYYVRTLV
ncbi:hypothetical protein FQR65_LT01817 [Abscondita terminalis]|nr:hypothetical protein FQR65_LT01817 [Abscondita terminalis]